MDCQPKLEALSEHPTGKGDCRFNKPSKFHIDFDNPLQFLCRTEQRAQILFSYRLIVA